MHIHVYLYEPSSNDPMMTARENKNERCLMPPVGVVERSMVCGYSRQVTLVDTWKDSCGDVNVVFLNMKFSLSLACIHSIEMHEGKREGLKSLHTLVFHTF